MLSPAIFFERIQQQLDDKLPFVAYRHPNAESVNAQLQQDATLSYLKNFHQQGFVFAPFDSTEKAIFFESLSAKTITTKNSLIAAEEVSEEISIPTTLQQKITHEKLIEKAVEEIKQSTLQKVVLSRAQQVVVQTDVLCYFRRLLKSYSTAFVYCWYHPKIGLWLGATPETLLKTEGNRFESMALAGTQAYRGNLEVKWGEKEKEEQAIVSRAITKGLHTISGVSSVKESAVHTHRAGGVLHLKTDITGLFRRESLGEIVRVLHPTPAVCGLPKEQAKNFIHTHETYNRNFYTGYLGEVNTIVEKSRNSRRQNVENSVYKSRKQQTNLYVNLRCMQVFNQKVVLYIGGGITADSIATAEWEETVKKAETMQKVL